MDKVSKVLEYVSRVFKKNFAYPMGSRPTNDRVILHCLLSIEAGSLSARFTLEELEELVSQIDGSKSPSLDGFNFSLYKNI